MKSNQMKSNQMTRSDNERLMILAYLVWGKKSHKP